MTLIGRDVHPTNGSFQIENCQHPLLLLLVTNVNFYCCDFLLLSSHTITLPLYYLTFIPCRSHNLPTSYLTLTSSRVLSLCFSAVFKPVQLLFETSHNNNVSIQSHRPYWRLPWYWLGCSSDFASAIPQACFSR